MTLYKQNTYTDNSIQITVHEKIPEPQTNQSQIMQKELLENNRL